MERLTEKDAFGEYVELNENKTCYKGAGGFMRGNIISKLAAYEDTGLEPSEVAALKAENKELKKQVEGSHKNQTDLVNGATYHLREKDKRIAVLERALNIIEEMRLCDISISKMLALMQAGREIAEEKSHAEN